MTKGLRILIRILLCLVAAAGCYFWVTNMVDSNYDYRSPIKDNPPAAGDQLGKASTRRVVIVLIDALRYDTSINSELMPNLAQLRQQGASALMYSQPPSYSEPGYSTILTGAWPWLNDGPVLNLEYPDIPTFTQDNLFSAAHRAGLTTAISGYYWFEKLVPQSDVDLSFYTPGEDNTADQEVMTAALPWLQADNSQLVLIHLDQVDYAGHHQGGPKGEEWGKATTRTDAMLGQIAATLDFNQDTLLVISDHGQIDAGGHGGQDAIVLQEPFVLVGAGVKPGKFSDVNMVDVAPTLAALLGVNLPASAQGQVRTEMLSLDPSVTASLPKAVESQQTTLLSTFATAIGEKVSEMPTGSDVSKYQEVMNGLREKKENSERIPRAAAAVLFVAAVIYWLGKNIHSGAIAWIIGGLTFALLFNYRYGMWDAKTYSFSSVISENEMISYVAITTALAFAIAWLILLLDQRYFKLTPGDAALKVLGLTLTAAFINGLPAIYSFAVNGAIITWTLPEYLSEFLGMLGLIEAIFICATGLVCTGLTAWIAFRYNCKVNEPVENKK